MTHRDTKIALELKSRLKKAGGDSVFRIIFFGSRARGIAHEDSDMDVAVLVTHRTKELQRLLEDEAYQIMLKHDFSPIISLKVLDRKCYTQALADGFSFYRQLETARVEL